MKHEKNCMAHGCTQKVSGSHLLCVDHWRILPATVQRAVSERQYGWKDEGAARIYLANHYRLEALKRAVASEKGVAA